jgi:hypothetical protein
MSENKKQPVSTGKKGGAVFPRANLEEAVGYAKKLVSKTHIGAQPHTTIFPGVFGVNPNNTSGGIRASALKQYGLLRGQRDAYEATDLAKRIASAPTEELPPLLRQAFLNPKLFKVLFDTFQGDLVSLAKLRQQASSSEVHPDLAETCAQLFVQSAQFAKIGELEGDGIKLSPASTDTYSLLNSDNDESDQIESELDSENDVAPDIAADPVQNNLAGNTQNMPAASARSIIHVNVTIDSSLDTDKLERQLLLLRKYGAI